MVQRTYGEYNLHSLETNFILDNERSLINFSAVFSGNRGSLKRNDSTSQVGHKSAIERV